MPSSIAAAFLISDNSHLYIQGIHPTCDVAVVANMACSHITTRVWVVIIFAMDTSRYAVLTRPQRLLLKLRHVSKQAGSQGSSRLKHGHELGIVEEILEIVSAIFFNAVMEGLVGHVLVLIELGDGIDEIVAFPRVFGERLKVIGDFLEQSRYVILVGNYEDLRVEEERTGRRGFVRQVIDVSKHGDDSTGIFVVDKIHAVVFSLLVFC